MLAVLFYIIAAHDFIIYIFALFILFFYAIAYKYHPISSQHNLC
jgi:hypothetical protein